MSTSGFQSRRAWAPNVVLRVVLALVALTAAPWPVCAQDVDPVPSFADPVEPLETGPLLFVRASARYEVFLDARSVGFAPLLLSDLRPGDHSLEVRSDAMIERRRLRVSAAPATVVVYSPAVHPYTGSLRVTSEPSGAAVCIAGQVAGTTPLLLEGVAATRYVVDLTLDGFAPVTREVDVSNGQTVALSVSLLAVAPDADAPKVGLVTFEHFPEAGRVFLDETEMTGNLVSASLEVPEGRHLISVVAPRYATATWSVTAVAGDSFNLAPPVLGQNVVVRNDRLTTGLMTIAPGLLLAAGGIFMNVDSVAVAVSPDYSTYEMVKYTSLGTAVAGVGLALVGAFLLLR